MYRINHSFTYHELNYDKLTSQMHNERKYALYCDQYWKELMEARNSVEIARKVINISVKHCE
jgi:hypothetical protein